ncbi:hypothetical protein HZB58_02325 [Candidatus Gottesmanbacteria bacterium]|nr:hypothetical protein [Candidatus Gottesmanbacteria bacterium]
MANEDEPIHIEKDDDLTREIAEFHHERDTEAVRSGTKANNTLKGTRDKAWEESKYQLPDGMTLLEFLTRKRKRERPKRQK